MNTSAIQIYEKAKVQQACIKKNIIGEGAQAKVYKAQLCEGGPLLAVKKLPDIEVGRRNNIQNYIVKMLKTEQPKEGGHPHLVRCLGYCPDPPALIYEFMDGGDLQKVLNSKKLRS